MLTGCEDEEVRTRDTAHTSLESQHISAAADSTSSDSQPTDVGIQRDSVAWGQDLD